MRDAGTPEGTHGFAFKNGNFSSVGFGGLWFLIATNKEERGSQQCHAGKAFPYVIILMRTVANYTKLCLYAENNEKGPAGPLFDINRD